MIDIHQKGFISLFLTPFIGLEILTFSGMVCARQLTICPSCLGLVEMCGILGCLEGVWEVSGGCLSDSGYYLGGYDMQAIDKHLIRLIFIFFFLFSLLPRIGQNVAYIGVSVGCLEGVR